MENRHCGGVGKFGSVVVAMVGSNGPTSVNSIGSGYLQSKQFGLLNCCVSYRTIHNCGRLELVVLRLHSDTSEAPLATFLNVQPITMAPALGVFDDNSSDNMRNGALGKTTSGKSLKIRTYPKFDSLEGERLYRKQHLAAAFRIFADRGFDEGVAGHISVRDPILTDHFCKSHTAISMLAVCQLANRVQG